MRVIRSLGRILALSTRHHGWGSLAIVVFAAVVISGQVTDRSGFANAELRRDVMERWGAPIVQAAPSVRYVPSGTVFHELQALPLERQSVEVDAAMSYRKRGLVYFSGFEFALRASYRLRNDRGRPIDVAFVFPIDLERNRVLLSGLSFSVEGKPERIDLADEGSQLLWTGRVEAGKEVDFAIAYQGRGLDSFVYKLDPALPARNVDVAIRIVGGDNHEFDYPPGVVSAATTEVEDDGVALAWSFRSLESGVPVGVILPSEKSFDRVIATMAGRGIVTFLLLFLALGAVCLHHGRVLSVDQAYLVAAAYGFFFVLLAYLAAYLHFYVAYAVTLVVIGTLIHRLLVRAIDPSAGPIVLALLAAFLFVPTLAVILERHTGLIYCLEILAGLAALMAFTTRTWYRDIVDRLGTLPGSPGTGPGPEPATVPATGSLLGGASEGGQP